MRVFVDKKVKAVLDSFYTAALKLHVSLDEEVVVQKKDRLLDSLESLGAFPSKYPLSRVHREWIQKGYREFIVEDFHFAYEVCEDEEGLPFVWVHDAVHSLLNH